MPRKGDISYEALGRWGLLRGGGAQCLYGPNTLVSVPDPGSLDTKKRLEGLDWERLGYVTYVTHKDVLCNAVMLFADLQRLGSKAKRIMMIPDTEEFKTEDYSSRSAEEDQVVKRLLKEAEGEYGVVLVRVRVVRKELSFSTSFSPHFFPFAISYLKPINSGWALVANIKCLEMWAQSYTKLHAFNLTYYHRLLILDSDATLLRPLDELFLLPPSPITLPRAYWLDTPTLASHIMLITPSSEQFSSIEKAVGKAGLGVYDMEIVNQLFGKMCQVMPHQRYALLTGEFRRDRDKHMQYLDPGEVWNATQIRENARLVHFSDYPMPKPVSYLLPLFLHFKLLSLVVQEDVLIFKTRFVDKYLLIYCPVGRNQ
jgi:hypothetical protein